MNLNHPSSRGFVLKDHLRISVNQPVVRKLTYNKGIHIHWGYPPPTNSNSEIMKNL